MLCFCSIKKVNYKLFFKNNKYLILILVISSIFLFTGLGDRNIGCDETWMVIGAENTLTNGYPYISKTFGFFSEPFELSEDSWFTYYLLAGFYLVFGITNFVSRLPFALFGLSTILFFYFFTNYLTKNRKIAYLATFLLATSYPFYSHARQARYFSVVMFLTLLLCYSYLKILDRKGIGFDILFIVSNTVFFYTHIQLWFYIAASLMLHFFIFAFDKKYFKRFVIDTLACLFLFSPWLYYWTFMNSWLFETKVPTSILGFLFKLILSFYYYFIIVFSVIFLLLLFLYKKSREQILFNKKYTFIFTVILGLFVLISLLGFNPLPEARIIVSGTLPLSMILVAHMIYILNQKLKLLSVVLTILLIFSNLLLVIPLYPLKIIGVDDMVNYDGQYIPDFLDRSLNVNFGLWNIILEISHDYMSIYDSIFPKLDNLGISNGEYTIITDLDFNQLNYQSSKMGLRLVFQQFDSKSDRLNYSIYLINYEENKKLLLDNLDDDFDLEYIEDYEDTIWQDSPNPIYRRYGRIKDRNMVLAYKIS